MQALMCSGYKLTYMYTILLLSFQSVSLIEPNMPSILLVKSQRLNLSEHLSVFVLAQTIPDPDKYMCRFGGIDALDR